MTLQEMIDAFIEGTCAGKSNETPTAYRAKLRHLQKYLGNNSTGIDQGEIDQFKTYLLNRKSKIRGGKKIKGKLSEFTIRSVLSTTRHFLRWIYQKGIIPQGIELQNIREPKPDPKAIEPETFERLLLVAETLGEPWEQSRNTAILYTLRDTGGRVGSLARLELESIDLEKGFATVLDKGNQLSWLWFNAPSCQAIREWLKYRNELEPSDYRLFSGAKGYGLTRQGIYRVLQRLAKKAKIKGRYNPHAFRHAFARDAIMAGADLSIVADLMNHANVVVTQKYYARWKKKELKRFHKKFSPGRLLPGIG